MTAVASLVIIESSTTLHAKATLGDHLFQLNAWPLGQAGPVLGILVFDETPMQRYLAYCKEARHQAEGPHGFQLTRIGGLALSLGRAPRSVRDVVGSSQRQFANLVGVPPRTPLSRISAELIFADRA